MKKLLYSPAFTGIIWSAITLFFDYRLGSAFINQLHARNFSQTTGYITHSKVTSNDSGEGTMYGVSIRYRYEVNGRTFEGNRLRFGAGAYSEPDWAESAVDNYPEGAHVTVYYNSGRPSESVLEPGTKGSNPMLFLFMTPFNAVMLGFWIAGFSNLKEQFSPSPNGGVKFFRNEHRLRVRLPRYPALYRLLATTGLLAFLAQFPIAIFGGGFNPRPSTALAAIYLAYGYGLLTFLWTLWVNNSGRSDLIIDYTRQIVELPRTFGRKTKLQIDMSDITRFTVRTATQSSEDDVRYTYIPTLFWQNGDPAQGKLLEFYNKPKAERFVDWLLPLLESNGESENVGSENSSGGSVAK